MDREMSARKKKEGLRKEQELETRARIGANNVPFCRDIDLSIRVSKRRLAANMDIESTMTALALT